MSFPTRGKLFLPILFSVLSCNLVTAQISPPGLGKANTASWLALALRQGLDATNHVQSISYIGFGSISHPSDYNPLRKPSLFVLNEELNNQFHQHWQYSIAISYRRQNEYKDMFPYQEDTPRIKQEFRLYGRYAYLLKKNSYSLALTYRQEFRKFFTPDFNNWDDDMQLRSRFRAQVKLNVNAAKTRHIILSTEGLFTSNRTYKPRIEWGKLSYSETRFCLYYAITPAGRNFTLNIGYMNQLLGRKYPLDMHYLAIDLIWSNPFGNPERKQIKPAENLE